MYCWYTNISRTHKYSTCDSEIEGDLFSDNKRQMPAQISMMMNHCPPQQTHYSLCTISIFSISTFRVHFIDYLIFLFFFLSNVRANELTMDSIKSILPPVLPGVSGAIVTAIQLFLAAKNYGNEVNPETRTKYSKFSDAAKRMVGANDNTDNNHNKKPTWSSRKAMMVIYTPALLASAALLALNVVPITSKGAIFVVIHFLKRVLEVLFVHEYSGNVDTETPTGISIFYLLVAVLACCASDYHPTETMCNIGAQLFLIGIAGNLYHHYLLAQLRRNNNSNNGAIADQEPPKERYVAPRGGLFEYVATPHYLFEIIGWFGIAVVSNHANVYLIAASMSSYLAGRSVAQNEFNRSKFDKMEWPKSRKNLIPYLF